MSDINIAAVDSLKVLDPNRPIREADMAPKRGMSASDPSRASAAIFVLCLSLRWPSIREFI